MEGTVTLKTVTNAWQQWNKLRKVALVAEVNVTVLTSRCISIDHAYFYDVLQLPPQSASLSGT